MPRATKKPEPPAPRAEFMTVTPEMAMDWLTRNESNRKIRPYKVNDYVRDIEASNWTYSNDGICLAPDGSLLNGQHRLTAIFEAGKPAVLLVIHDMPPEAMIAMDRGTSRTVADLLGLHGHLNTHMLGSITKLCIVIDSGRIYGDNKYARATDSEIEDFIAANPVVEHIASYVSTIKSHVDCSPSAIGGAYWLIQEVNGTSLTEFYLDQLATRQNEPSGSAVLAVDSRLRSIRRERTPYTQREIVAFLIRGWNYYAVDKRVSTLPMTTRGEFRIPEVAGWARGEGLVAS